jgi:5'-3' exonuclease
VAGNDFLPHLPSLDIHEGAIGEMIRIYKEAVSQGRITGWLSSRGNCNLERCGVVGLFCWYQGSFAEAW